MTLVRYNQEQNTEEKNELFRPITIKQDRGIKGSEDAQFDMTSRNMRNNIMAHNIPEYLNEDTEQKVKYLLTQQHIMESLEVSGLLQFDKVHTVGPSILKNQTEGLRDVMQKYRPNVESI